MQKNGTIFFPSSCLCGPHMHDLWQLLIPIVKGEKNTAISPESGFKIRNMMRRS